MVTNATGYWAPGLLLNQSIPPLQHLPLLTSFHHQLPTGLNWTAFSIHFQEAIEVKGFWGHFDGTTVMQLRAHLPQLKTMLQSISGWKMSIVWRLCLFTITLTTLWSEYTWKLPWKINGIWLSRTFSFYGLEVPADKGNIHEFLDELWVEKEMLSHLWCCYQWQGLLLHHYHFHSLSPLQLCIESACKCNCIPQHRWSTLTSWLHWSLRNMITIFPSAPGIWLQNPWRLMTKTRLCLHHQVVKWSGSVNFMVCAGIVERRVILRISALSLWKMWRTTHQRTAALPMLLLNLIQKMGLPFLLEASGNLIVISLT